MYEYNLIIMDVSWIRILQNQAIVLQMIKDAIVRLFVQRAKL